MAQVEIRDRAPRAVTVDAALGALVVGVIATAITANLGTTTRQPVAAYAFAVGLGALMLVRRRWPVGTLLVTAAALLGYYALNFPPVGLAVPAAAALYSAAEAGRLRWAIGTAAALVVISTFFRVREGDDLAYLFGYEFAVTATLMAAVIALGDSVRSRQRWRAELRRQAAAAQAEREQEATRRVEQERLRIARELHDVLAHTISIVSLHSDVAREALRDDPDAAETALCAIRTATNDASRELRATLELLREPGAAARRDPPAGLAGLDALVRAAADGGVRVELCVAGEVVALPAVVDATAHRIVQESITNVLRHAGAATATVELHYGGDTLTVRVSDDIAVVGEAADGASGLALVAAQRPDVVLMDIRMPGVDGLEATRRILADERLRAVQVVVLTTFDTDEHVFEAIRSGAAGFLLKDTSPEDLRRAVRIVASGDALPAPTSAACSPSSALVIAPSSSSSPTKPVWSFPAPRDESRVHALRISSKANRTGCSSWV